VKRAWRVLYLSSLGLKARHTVSTAIAPVSCPLDNYLVLPDNSLESRIQAAKDTLGTDCIILGHHYQRDEVIRFADFRGDSYRLARAASESSARYIVFCGVHFMAESADVLGHEGQAVILPDLNAGCSMADMAEITQVEDAWEHFVRAGITDEEGHGVTPITYVNSTAAIKAFCGERGGLVCTSSNAKGAYDWATARNEKLFFLPDQHLGRNTGFAKGIPLNEMVVWDPYMLNGGLTNEQMKRAKVILWKGHCSVHQRFLPEHIEHMRASHPGVQIVAHPECRWEVCQKADATGSTDFIIKYVKAAPAGSTIAIGTEIHLVHRLAAENPDKTVLSLDDSGCLCTTMFRISPQHLCWALENLVDGNVVNQIKVKSNVKEWAKVALDRMLEVK
jgi:quinolinate synthase